MTDFDRTSFLTGANAGFIAGLYRRFLENPEAVDEGRREFFAEPGDDAAAFEAGERPPTRPRETPVKVNGALAPAVDGPRLRAPTLDSIRAF